MEWCKPTACAVLMLGEERCRLCEEEEEGSDLKKEGRKGLEVTELAEEESGYEV